MNETSKTLAYLGVAAVVLLLAFLSLPGEPEVGNEARLGEILYEASDTLKATKLRIVEFNEATSKAREFDVTRTSDGWVIPSHSGYPADAEKQMGEAAKNITNLKILGVAGESRGSHETFGVVNPEDDKTTTGSKGVGTRVTMKDAKGEDLVDMIIGNEVKEVEGQRYVRQVGKDIVYVVELDPSKLSTKFDTWIEEDLLKLSVFNVEGLKLNDYSIEVGIGVDGRPRVLMDPRGEISLTNDPNAETAQQWKIVKLKDFDREKGEYNEVPVPEGAELDAAKLNELKNALDDLKIVDVERKPQGLSDDLKAEKEFVTNEEAFRSLAERGFFPVPVAEDKLEILSSEGEVICQMNDGVEYVLRFGNTVAGAGGGGEEGGDADTDSSGINRYLFITTRFNEDLLDEPQLEELPGEPANKTEPAEQKPAKEDKPQDESKTGDAEKPAPPKKATPETNPTPKNDKPPKAPEPGDEGEEGEVGAEGKEADAGPAEAAQEEPKNATTTDEPPTDAGEKQVEGPDDKPDDEPAEQPALTDEDRKRIERENQSKLDEYNAKVAKGKERVKELNARFGDWYYVISDSVYKKIHLGRKDIMIEPKQPAEGLEALDELKKQGLESIEQPGE
jgi:hypothetical protein